MNHLFHQITWHQYLIAVLVMTIIYYLTVILRCYRPELQNLQRRFNGDRLDESLKALQYQPAEEKEQTTAVGLDVPGEYLQQEEPIVESDILGSKLKASIARAADKPFAPAILIPQLKQILQEHQHIAATERPAIDHLIVNECEKTGTALLTEAEVDQWWER